MMQWSLFVYAGGPIALTDIRTRGVRYAGPGGAEIQGWLRARKQGATRSAPASMPTSELGACSPQPASCKLGWKTAASISVHSCQLFWQQRRNASLVLGAELQPGLYRLRVWTTCTAPHAVTTASELLLKAPSELNLRAVTGSDLLHHEE